MPNPRGPPSVCLVGQRYKWDKVLLQKTRWEDKVILAHFSSPAEGRQAGGSYAFEKLATSFFGSFKECEVTPSQPVGVVFIKP